MARSVWAGTTIKWNGTTVSSVVDFDISPTINTADCTTLDSLQVDNRKSLDNPTATLTVSLKASNPTLVLGSVGKFTVEDTPGSFLSSDLKYKITGAQIGGGAEDHATVTFTFVSTDAAVDGGGAT